MCDRQNILVDVDEAEKIKEKEKYRRAGKKFYERLMANLQNGNPDAGC